MVLYTLRIVHVNCFCASYFFAACLLKRGDFTPTSDLRFCEAEYLIGIANHCYSSSCSIEVALPKSWQKRLGIFDLRDRLRHLENTLEIFGILASSLIFLQCSILANQLPCNIQESTVIYNNFILWTTSETLVGLINKKIFEMFRCVPWFCLCLIR